jgi:predicted DNA-binding protein
LSELGQSSADRAPRLLFRFHPEPQGPDDLAIAGRAVLFGFAVKKILDVFGHPDNDALHRHFFAHVEDLQVCRGAIGMPYWQDLVNDFMPGGSKVATKKKRAAESIHDRDRIIVRLPDGMRDQLANLAEANGRSMTAEVVAAIERHLKGIDRVTQIWETLKKYQQDIEDIGLIRQAVLNLEGAMEDVGEDNVFYGVLRRNSAAKREGERKAKLPPITTEQAAQIRALIKETNAPENKLLKLLKASSVEEIREFDRAVFILEQRKKYPPA